jgi:AcrR family transcriptional regulator
MQSLEDEEWLVDTPSMQAAVQEQLRSKRSELMSTELERVALRLFHERGYAAVTVEEIAVQAQISARTFYRYFQTKEQLLQVRIDLRAVALDAALAARDDEEDPLQSLRDALIEVMASEDAELTRWWISTIASTPELVPGVLGGVQLKLQRSIAVFLARRSGLLEDALVPTALAAAIGGVVQVSLFRWFTNHGDLPGTIAEGLDSLQLLGTDPTTWAASEGSGTELGVVVGRAKRGNQP